MPSSVSIPDVSSESSTLFITWAYVGSVLALSTSTFGSSYLYGESVSTVNGELTRVTPPWSTGASTIWVNFLALSYARVAAETYGNFSYTNPPPGSDLNSRFGETLPTPSSSLLLFSILRPSSVSMRW